MPPTTTSSYQVKEDKKKLKGMIREIELSLIPDYLCKKF